jgi:3'(2'), 5'-bisphosphate nucleotidase
MINNFLLHHCRKAISEACLLARSAQKSISDIKQHQKKDYSPVTVADYAIQMLIAYRLQRAGQSPLLLAGEEDSNSLRSDDTLAKAVTECVGQTLRGITTNEVLDTIDLGNHDATSERYWTLDPIDGTKGFLRGGHYAISLALIDQGEVVFGIMGCPNLSTRLMDPLDAPGGKGCIFHASKDGGCWVTADDLTDSQPSPIAVSGDSFSDKRTIRICGSVEWRHSSVNANKKIAEQLNMNSKTIQMDSQCKYSIVARGQADAYIRLPTDKLYIEKIWDHAAGKLIAEEAGVIVTDARGNTLDFGQGRLLQKNQGIVCSSRALHTPILQSIELLHLV